MLCYKRLLNYKIYHNFLPLFYYYVKDEVVDEIPWGFLAATIVSDFEKIADIKYSLKLVVFLNK